MRRIRIILDLVVTDEAALRSYAESRVRAAWDERLDVFAPNVPLMAYEALIGSSEGPPLSDIGLAVFDKSVAEVAP